LFLVVVSVSEWNVTMLRFSGNVLITVRLRQVTGWKLVPNVLRYEQ